MKKFYSVILLLTILFIRISDLNAQKQAWALYDSGGRKISYEKMLSRLSDADVILFGEQHDNAIAHWLELEVTKDLFAIHGNKLVLGAEMFETDNQLIMNEYLNGSFPSDKFEDEMRLWKNYRTDYKPLVEFARENHLSFIATNIPRRYAGMVFKLGLDTLAFLSEEARSYFVPLPLVYDTSLTCYSALSGGAQGMMEGHGSSNLRDAQAIKDATMAWIILLHMQDSSVFLHFNGAYHSDNKESIVYFLRREMPDLKIMTISTVILEDPLQAEEEINELADFIICVDEDVTRTY
ncbi:MAG: ChaN family lipoprotein [Bacteroidota bacterium]